MQPVWYFLNGVPVIPVLNVGVTLAADGTASAPSYSFASTPNLGLYRINGAAMGVAVSGGLVSYFGTGGLVSNTLVLDVTNADVSLSRGAANRLDLASGDTFYAPTALCVGSNVITTSGRLTADTFGLNGGNGSATSAIRLIKKVTGIADAVATDVITVTVPNANHAAAISVTFLASTGSTDAFESSRIAEGTVILARTTGVATVAAVTTLEQAQIATVSAGATLTLAYGVSSMTGAAGAQQTFTIQVTLNDSGNVGLNQCVVVAEVINAESSGVTIA